MEKILEHHLRAKTPLVWMSTQEENRSSHRILAVAGKLKLAVFSWSCVDGFKQLTSGQLRLPGEGHTNIDQALNAVGQYRQKEAVFIFQDMPQLLKKLENTPEYVVIQRRIKDSFEPLRQQGNTIIFLSSSSVMPPELQGYLSLIEVPLPDQNERFSILGSWIRAHSDGIPCNLAEDDLHRLASVAAGMNSLQIQSALSLSVVRHKGLVSACVDDVLAAKISIVKSSEILEFIQPAETFDDVGGLANVKDYCRKRALAFGPAARRAGLPVPKGIILTGPPGTGKTLLAVSVGNYLRLPVIRLDVGKIFTSLLGQSEERMRQAIALAETAAPIVFLIDELEKAFAGVGGNSLDGGTAQRIFGTFLTWMQERTSPILVFATANDISHLPAEFLRKGRFDEIFFVDLPNTQERRAILEVLFRKHKISPPGLISERFVSRLDRFSGAELDSIIGEAMYTAFSDSQRPVTLDDMETAAAKMVPLADQMHDAIEALRQWGKTHAVSAS